MTGSSDSNRSESQGGIREELSTKEGRNKGNDRRNTNRQRGRMRAISVLGNAKSNRHRKTHQVEPDGTGPKRMFMHLSRGDLRRESAGEVSRGRSSEEACRKAGGAKGRRTTERATKTGLRSGGGKLSDYSQALSSHAIDLEQEFHELHGVWSAFSQTYEGSGADHFRSYWLRTEQAFNEYIQQSHKIRSLLEERIEALTKLDSTSPGL